MSATFTTVDRGFTPGSPVAGSVYNGYKLNPVGIGTYFRMYPGFDGVAANGLRYGAAVEIRTNFGAGNAATIDGPAGVGPATSPSGITNSETLFVRRAFAYLANDNVGLFRFGQSDGVLGLFDPCIFTTQCWDAGIGNFNGGIEQNFGPAGPAIPFVWLSQAGAEYGNSKIVYLSPQMFGFDFGLQYAPSEGNSFQNEGSGAGCNQASPGCISLSAGNDPTRWINQFAAGLRYQHTFGPVDVKAYGLWETAGKENLTTGPYGLPGPTTNPQALRYDNLGFWSMGAAVSAANITVAADYLTGSVNNQLNMKPEGGAPMSAVLTGLTYANGPVILGAEIGMVNDQGAAQLTGFSQQHDVEIAFGGNYKLAPGVQLVGEYMYEYRHQGAFDFNSGAVGAIQPNGARLTRDARANALVFSTVLTW
jgi:predicted porin